MPFKWPHSVMVRTPPALCSFYQLSDKTLYYKSIRQEKGIFFTLGTKRGISGAYPAAQTLPLLFLLRLNFHLCWKRLVSKTSEGKEWLDKYRQKNIAFEMQSLLPKYSSCKNYLEEFLFLLGNPMLLHNCDFSYRLELLSGLGRRESIRFDKIIFNWKLLHYLNFNCKKKKY